MFLDFIVEAIRDGSSGSTADLERALLDMFSTADDSGSEPGRIRVAQLFVGGRGRAEELLTAAIQRAREPGEDAPAVAQTVIDQLSAEPATFTGAEVIAAALSTHSVSHVFAYPGTSELALCDAVETAEGIRLVNGRGDKESAFMAAGASLPHPNRGAAILHGARGLTNAGGALAESRRNEAGTVFVVGLPSTRSARFLPPHGEDNLVETMDAFAGWSWQAPAVPTDSPDRIATGRQFVTKVHEGLIAAAEPPCRPSLLGLSQDVAEARWVPAAALLDYQEPTQYLPFSRTVVNEVVSALRTARRPVIVVDDYALRYQSMRRSLDQVSRMAGAPVSQVRYRRGPMLFERLHYDEVEGFIGWLNQFSDAHRSLLQECDLLMTVEDRNLYERVVGPLPTCRKIAVNSDPAKVIKNEYLHAGDILAVGDPGRIMEAIAERLHEPPTPRPAWFSASLHRDARDAPERPSEAVQYGRRALVRAMARTLADWNRPVLVDDSQMFGGLIADHYDELPQGLRVFGGHGGFVGGGLAYAIGMAVGNPDLRVMCTLGDQGFTNALQGLVAAVQERARVVFVVCNNGEAVSLNKQARATLAKRDRDYLTNVPTFRYHEVARTIGMPAAHEFVPLGDSADVIDKVVKEVTAALEELAAHHGPSLLELTLPSDPVVWRGIWINQGFEQMPAGTSGGAR